MAVKGSRRARRSRRGRTKRQLCAKHFRGRGRQRGGQAAAATELPAGTAAFSVRWPSLGAGKAVPAAAGAASPPPLLERQEAAALPAVSIPPGGPYTLAVWDPDAPQASWLHWLVVNIPGGDSLSEGSTVSSWAPPTPPPGTGTHTYIFGLFLQGATPLDPKAVAQQAALTRAHFNPARFAEQYGLRQIDNKRIAISAGPLP